MLGASRFFTAQDKTRDGHTRLVGWRGISAIIVLLVTTPFVFSQESGDDLSAKSSRSDSVTDQANDLAIKRAFADSHDGWSVDEVLLEDARRQAFLKAVRMQMNVNTTELSDKQIFERLIQLRKAGKLEIKATQRAMSDLDSYLPVAEIASRLMMDQHDANVDQWLVDPDLLHEFDEIVQGIAPESSTYEARKAALKLRKSRRLQPELLARVTDWKREIRIMSVEQAMAALNELPKNAGVYIFRDASGFLYIGQSNNLRTRLTKHLDQSDRKSLCNYLQSKNTKEITLELHVFAKDSPAADTVVREAYESDLIRTRKPRFNVAP